MWRWLLVLGVSACGRFGFDETAGDGSDATPDTASPCTTRVGHDEDLDAIDDGCDVCPHLSDPAQLDGDDDGVGDICDPNPTLAGDRIVVFDPFTGPRPEWSNPAAMTFANDQLVVTANAVQRIFTLATAPGRDLFIMSGTLQAMGASPRQILIGMQSADGSYYCELYDDGSPKFAITYTTDHVVFDAVDQQAVTGPFENAPIAMTFAHTPTTLRCDVSWPGTRTLDGVLPVPITQLTKAELSFIHVDATLDYFVQIRPR